jgi:hypothetical protein
MIPEEVRAQSLQIARAFAEVSSHYKPFKRPLELSRRLKGIGSDPQLFENTIRHYCRLTKTRFRDFWEQFQIAWDNVLYVTLPEHRVQWAYRCSEEKLIHLPSGIYLSAKSCRWLYSVCCYLAQYHGNDPFWLSTRVLARVFNLSEQTIWRAIGTLKRHKLIVEDVNAGYVPRKKCKRYYLNPNV